MLALLAVSALRSIALGAAVWLALTLPRIRNPHVRMTVWTAVLIASLAMPVLTPWMKVTLPAASPWTSPAEIAWVRVPWIAASPAMPAESPSAASPQPYLAPSAPSHPVDWRLAATGIYALVSGVMLLRLFAGVMLTWRVVGAARPVGDLAVRDLSIGADIRVSEIVLVPVTFASTILLPSAYSEWSERKLRAVLLHEGAHVAHGDFIVLLLAAIHRAVFWFNPFSWWLLIRLTDLAEMVSDDVAIAGIDDRRGYADILLDVARNAQRLPSGLAMARPNTVRQRVDRILRETVPPAGLSRRRRALIAVALVPLAVLSAGTIVHKVMPMQIDAARLDRYVGYFQINVSSVLAVTRDGRELFAQLTGQPKLRLFAVHDHAFANERGDANITFAAGGDGPATEITLREPNLGSRRGVRVDAARAGEIEAVYDRRIVAAPGRYRDQTPIPGGEAALRQTIEDFRRGAPNSAGMSPQLAERLHRQLTQFNAMVDALGAVEAVSFAGVGPGGYDIYSVKFANGSAEFRIDLAPDGRLDDVTFRPDGDGTPGGVAACALEPTLNPSRDTAPIRLSLTNRSGTELRFFSLDLAGHRTFRGAFEDGGATTVLTFVGRPLVIADPSGQCREIVLPGQATQTHTVEPPGSAAVRRTTRIPGSDAALQHYIESVRGGDPDYDHMTPEGAAAARQKVLHQRAILAKLGALQTMSFHGVTPTGNDMYTVRFAGGSAEWRIRLAEEGRIGDIALGP